MKANMVMSSASSSRTPISSTPRNQRYARCNDGGDSCYYPGCRKDANCHCDICLDSFNATRDLVPSSSTSRIRSRHRSPPEKAVGPFASSDSEDTPLSTPTEPLSSLSVPSSPSPPPVPKHGSFYASERRAKKRSASRLPLSYKWKCTPEVICNQGIISTGRSIAGPYWGLVPLGTGFGVHGAGYDMKIGSDPKLTANMVRVIGEDARILEGNLGGSLGIVERRIEEVVGIGGVSNCSSMDSLWKLNQEGGHHFFFLWRCVIYRSMVEELSIWGSPLQTSGLLIAGASSRYISLLSGRITEWSDAKPSAISRTSNSSSWILAKWSSAAVQLEKETWVLEYQRNALLQGPGLIQTTMTVLRLRLRTIVKKLKWRLLMSRSIASSYYDKFGDKKHFQHPT